MTLPAVIVAGQSGHISHHIEIDKLLNTMWANVQDPDYGAVGDGSHVDTPGIIAAQNAMSSGGGGTVFFAPPTVHYKIDATLDLGGKSGITYYCPTVRSFPLTGVASSDNALIHWYGAANGVVVQLGGQGTISYGCSFINISINCRGIAADGFRLGTSANTASNVKFTRFTGCDVKYAAAVSWRFGGNIIAAQDIFPVWLTDCSSLSAAGTGLMCNSGNAGVFVKGFTALGNGATPPVGITGSHVYHVAGELRLSQFSSDDNGTPAATSLFAVDGGGFCVDQTWCDDLGVKTLTGSGSQITQCLLTGVRHVDGNMTSGTNPKCITYSGKSPIVTVNCHLFGSVELLAGNNSKWIDIGSTFADNFATVIKAASNEAINIGTRGGLTFDSGPGGNNIGTISGHLVSSGAVLTAASVLIDGHAGVGATFVSIDGNDISGVVTIHTGNSGLAAGLQVTITLTEQFLLTPRFVSWTSYHDAPFATQLFCGGASVGPPTTIQCASHAALPANTDVDLRWAIIG